MMKKISVLMSIYNEDWDEILESISSIINQSYKNIEIILVFDNKERKDFAEIYNQLSQMDNRIHIIVNEQNIGLANSMNIAFSYSTGEYIARMDADDIAMNLRFEKEVNILNQGKVDIVCTSYTMIDENSKQLDCKFNEYSNKELMIKLPYTNTVHHPTVMMTRTIFEKVKGYRNFPCSQDYDMWLRMLEVGARFYIINEPLLKYRIRNNSISISKSLQQSLTIMYIRKLMKERKTNGQDSFSENNYQLFLKKHKLYDEKYITSYNKWKKLKDKIDSMRGQRTIKKHLMKIYLCLNSSYYRMIYFNNLILMVQFKIQSLFNNNIS